MTQQLQKERMLGFIKQQKLTVVATSTKDGKPEAAVLEFIVNDKLEIIFDALPNFRKVKNIKENPSVAIVFGDEDNKTVQYEGEAYEITEESEIQKYQRISMEKYPGSREIINRSGLIWYRVKPKWARYLDVGTKPWQQFEINFLEEL